MAITVQHQPVGAMYNLAQKAGMAEYLKGQQERDDRSKLAMLEMQQRERMQRFQIQAEERARQEEMQFQQAMMLAKRDIDMQIETSQYARQKQMLTQAMNMINDSNEFDDEQKEKLKIQAMAKYAGVGTGISSKDFDSDKMTTLERQLTMGAYKANMAEQLQKDIDNEIISKETAERIAAGQGISGAKFYNREEKAAKGVSDAMERYNEARKVLEDTGIGEQETWTGKKRIWNFTDERDATPEEIQEYNTMKAIVQQRGQELEQIRKGREITTPVVGGIGKTESGKEQVMSRQQFVDEAQNNTALQQLIEIYKPDKAYDMYTKFLAENANLHPNVVAEKNKWKPYNNPMSKDEMIRGYGGRGI